MFQQFQSQSFRTFTDLKQIIFQSLETVADNDHVQNLAKRWQTGSLWLPSWWQVGNSSCKEVRVYYVNSTKYNLLVTG